MPVGGTRNPWPSLIVALAGCSAAPHAPLTDDAGDKLFAEGQRLAARGDRAEALQDFLVCLEWCPSPVQRYLTADEVHGLAQGDPKFERTTWDVVSRLESRVASATKTTELSLGDLTAVATVYGEWGKREAGMRFLHGLRDRSPAELYERGLKTFASAFPDAFVGMDDRDADTMLQAVRRAPGEHDGIAKSLKLPPEGVAELEKERGGVAVSFAAALVVGKRTEKAKELIAVALAGLGSSGCEVITREVDEAKNDDVKALARELCGIGKAAPNNPE